MKRLVIIAYNEHGNRIGETHHGARIPDELVDQIMNRYEEERDKFGTRPWGNGTRSLGIGYRKLAKEFGLSVNTVRKICTYERRAQTPQRWKRTYITAERLRDLQNG